MFTRKKIQVVNLFLWPLWLLFSSANFADEIRPAYLELMSDDGSHYQVTLKLPKKNNQLLSLSPVFPEDCDADKPTRHSDNEASRVSRWSLFCETGLSGKIIKIEGLAQSTTDILVRLQQPDLTQVARLFASNSEFYIAVQPSDFNVAKVYTVIGIEHILLGFDHLLFVFALLLIIKGKRRLFGAITAFTVAHSITLALASLNIATVALPPVEAVIALSILFLAVEIIHAQKGKPGIAEKSPWLVAFTFGLLHGFGFAGALAEVGLPQNAIPLALLFFNIGVEVGQLTFVLIVLMIATVLKPRLNVQSQKLAMLTMAYFIGSLATFWVYERTFSFLI